MDNVYGSDTIGRGEVSEATVRHEESGEAAVAQSAATTGKWSQVLQLLLGTLLIGSVFSFLQFSTQAILDVDGYYHIRWSRLLWEGMQRGVFPPAFPWLPLTTLNPHDYVDHHLLFHILLIPFTWFGDIRIGAKLAAAFFGSLAVLSCYWLIIRYRIRYSFVWLVALLACSGPFLFRLSMTRAQSVSIIFMVAGIHLLFRRRYWLLAPLAFLYVWTYSLWVMLGVAALIWAGVTYWTDRRIEWRPVAWTTLGGILGFVVNPYFPHNVMLFAEHVIMKVKPMEFTAQVGSEWYPYESWYFLGSCFVAFVSMVVGYIVFDWRDKRSAARPLFFLIFSTVLLLITARSRRFVEYWPPFAVLFAAFSLQPLFTGVRRMAGDVSDELVETADTYVKRKARHVWAALVLVLMMGVPLYFNVYYTWRTVSEDDSPFAYRGGMEWIRTNVPKGERVFNTDWDDFPKLFFYDTDHTYTAGLDPTYLLDENPQLFDIYKKITLGEIEDPGPIIRDRFGSRYIFTDKAEVHDGFYNNAMDSGWFEEVYDDQNCTVLRIRDTKEEPPPVEDQGPDDGQPDEQTEEPPAGEQPAG